MIELLTKTYSTMSLRMISPKLKIGILVNNNLIHAHHNKSGRSFFVRSIACSSLHCSTFGVFPEVSISGTLCPL